MDYSFQSAYGGWLLHAQGDGEPLDAARADLGRRPGMARARFRAVVEHGSRLRRLLENSCISAIAARLERAAVVLLSIRLDNDIIVMS